MTVKDLTPLDELVPPPTQLRRLAALIPRGQAMLLGITGHARGCRWLLDADSHVVGRSAVADIYLDDVTIAGRHARFTRRRDRWLLQDLDSLAGTWVNGEMVCESPLRSGDRIRIGAFVVLIVVGAAVSSPHSAAA